MSQDLAAIKREKLAKLKKEGLRDRDKQKAGADKAKDIIREEQDTYNKLLKHTDNLISEANIKDKNETIKDLMTKRMDSPMKNKLINTISSFVGEVIISPKVFKKMYT